MSINTPQKGQDFVIVLIKLKFIFSWREAIDKGGGNKGEEEIGGFGKSREVKDVDDKELLFIF